MRISGVNYQTCLHLDGTAWPIRNIASLSTLLNSFCQYRELCNLTLMSTLDILELTQTSTF
jgi:hypothetical protein